MPDARKALPSPEVILSQVATDYDFPAPLECVPVYSGLNDIYRIEARDTARVLKLYRAGWRTKGQVEAEVDVLRHLGRNGASIALPVPRRDGTFVGALALSDGDRQMVLFTEAKGKPVSGFNEPVCRGFGRALAEIHQASDDFTGGPTRYDMEHLLDQPLRALEPLLDDRTDDREYLRDLAVRLRAGLSDMAAPGLDWGLCHGDFRPANSHVEPATGVVTTFDFEAAGAGFRAYDLGTFLFFLAGAYEEQYERLAEAFLSGYPERRPLGSADRAAVPLFVLLRPIWILGNILKTAHRNWDLEPWAPPRVPGLPNAAFFEEVLQSIRRWDAAYL
jgi:Ser/Thr protein kinase RdoA (MazF antagonist)